MTWGTVKIGGAEYVAAISPGRVEVQGFRGDTDKVTIEGVTHRAKVLERYESRVVLEVKRGK